VQGSWTSPWGMGYLLICLMYSDPTLLFICSFSGTSFWTQNLVFAKQVFYQLNCIPALFTLVIFQIGSCFFFFFKLWVNDFFSLWFYQTNIGYSTNIRLISKDSSLLLQLSQISHHTLSEALSTDSLTIIPCAFEFSFLTYVYAKMC
jgi:hypothetical protein